VSFIALALEILGFDLRLTGAEDAARTAAMTFFQSITSIGWVDILGDFLDGLDALEHLKHPADCAFGFVSSSFGFHFVWWSLGSRPAPDHHHQS
jgi:hypothetical protein